MPWVRFQRAIAGARYTARRGHERDVPLAEAVGLCESGIAVPADPDVTVEQLREQLGRELPLRDEPPGELEGGSGDGDEQDGPGEGDGDGSAGEDPDGPDTEDVDTGAGGDREDGGGDEPGEEPVGGDESTVASWGPTAEPETPKPAKKAAAKRASRKRS